MTRWTNESVVKFAGTEDPVSLIEKKAREVVINAFKKGWFGPPYDPIKLAQILGIPVLARSDVKEARTVTRDTKTKELMIEFNPNRPRARIRYSIAHEIAHTFFPDCYKKVRNRAMHADITSDAWQLETLCNIAAAELIMPIGSFFNLRNEKAEINHLLDLRRELDVSTEAILIRSTKLASHPCAAFSASKVEAGKHKGRYRVDYVISNENWCKGVSRDFLIPEETILKECTAIGFTAKSNEEEWGGTKVEVQAVGLPAHPSAPNLRVAGIIMPTTTGCYKPDIEELYGDALNPRGSGARIVAHIVNSKTPNWGGRGFAVAVKSHFPEVQESFRGWAKQDASNFKLGNVHLADSESGLSFVNMIAQKNYGANASLDYEALASCLKQLAKIAQERNASVHMPRIGSGESRGSWNIVREYILAFLSNQNVPVTVYNLAKTNKPVTTDSLFEIAG